MIPAWCNGQNLAGVQTSSIEAPLVTSGFQSSELDGPREYHNMYEPISRFSSRLSEKGNQKLLQPKDQDREKGRLKGKVGSPILAHTARLRSHLKRA